MIVAEALWEGNEGKGRQAEDLASSGTELSWNFRLSVLIQFFLRFPGLNLKKDVQTAC